MRERETALMILLCACTARPPDAAPPPATQPTVIAVAPEEPVNEPAPADCPDKDRLLHPSSRQDAIESCLRHYYDTLVVERAEERVTDSAILEAPRSATEYGEPQPVPGLPFVRLFRAVGTRYPHAKILDIYGGRLIDNVDPAQMNALLRDANATVTSTQDAETLARAYVLLHFQHYGVRELVARPRAVGSGFEVQLRYERSVVWSPPGHPMIAGSKTTENVMQLQFTPDARMTVASERSVRVIRTSP